jgi:hypothetical protein
VGWEDFEGVRRTTWRAHIEDRTRKNRANATDELYHIGTYCQENTCKWLVLYEIAISR